jgi:hypothetical protein
VNNEVLELPREAEKVSAGGVSVSSGFPRFPTSHSRTCLQSQPVGRRILDPLSPAFLSLHKPSSSSSVLPTTYPTLTATPSSPF